MKVAQVLAVALICLHFRMGFGLSNYTFPSGFKFGAATASYTVEGAWNEDGKGASIWDNITHAFPSVIADGLNGDVAIDEYHRYTEDIPLFADIGLDFYKFSFSWPRILPQGTIDNINQKGLDYYDNLINLIISQGLEPQAVAFNFDIPWELEKVGGFTNDSTVQHFVDYTDLLFKTFGDRVKFWVTVNEGHAFCKLIVDDILSRVITQNLGFKEYQCAHNVIKAHAAAYRNYEQNYKASQQGKVGMAYSIYWYLPASNSQADQDAAVRARTFVFEWFAHPILKGDYPQVLIDQVGNLSQQEGRNVSRLPQFTAAEIANIKGSYDFVGVNAFRTFFATDRSNQNLTPSLQNDIRVTETTNASLDLSSVYISSPQTFRDSIIFASDYCDGCEIILTEHGFNTRNETLNDTARINFMQTYMDEVLIAINEDDINITAYTMWSAIDFFYFNFGETAKLGLIHVDFTSSNLTRTPKRSSEYYKNIIQTRSLTQFQV
ncbi:myrosinase 1-like [Cylas formicarius]|uniref:myrosinase 1-like n=1 Tax=Cylas formicarius TaxID=197179 RepID=UPI00295871E2|nr:myrosinase 1-like [Cylas formicarius]